MIRGIFWGLTVAWIGVWIWLGSIVAPALFAFKVAWPIIFVLVGFMMLVEVLQRAVRCRCKSRGSGWKIFIGLLFVAVGIVIWFSNIGLLVPGFAQLWPFLIVAVGVAIILKVIIKKSRKPRGVNVIIDNLEDGSIDVDAAVEEIRQTRRKGCHRHE